jgi:hypothetical protein
MSIARAVKAVKNKQEQRHCVVMRLTNHRLCANLYAM